jgi:hypothetical protein
MILHQPCDALAVLAVRSLVMVQRQRAPQVRERAAEVAALLAGKPAAVEGLVAGRVPFDHLCTWS